MRHFVLYLERPYTPFKQGVRGSNPRRGTKRYATLWVAYLFARRGEKRHPILRERSEQAKSRQNSPVDCFAVERRNGPRCASRPADTFVSAKRGAVLKAACCIRRRRRCTAFPDGCLVAVGVLIGFPIYYSPQYCYNVPTNRKVSAAL